MAPAEGSSGSLRERKQRRAREAIIEAAHELFAERGFDEVTVTDIAERAEVGRSTFFRYFGDKQEVAFAGRGPADWAQTLVDQVPAPEHIGDSLPAALGYVRALVVAYVGALATEPERFHLHEHLVACNQELHARSVLKQRAYADTLADVLAHHGAEPATARLAAEVGLACYYAGRAEVDEPERLPEAVDAVFERLG